MLLINILALGYGIICISLTFVAAQLGGVLQVHFYHFCFPREYVESINF